MSGQDDQKRSDRWRALTRYDAEIAPLAEVLSAFGSKWVDEFANAFFALDEDRSYLSTIAQRLISEAETERKETIARNEAEARNIWMTRIQRTNNGEATSEYSLKVLEKALTLGFEVTPAENYVIQVSKIGIGTSYLHSNADIARFASIQKIHIQDP